jgi:phospholipid/cholesterol/gamma-HCH transport system substrate-binding protein
METRANNVFVGAVTLALLAALAAFFIWIARLNEGEQKKYDIFFKQSVNGLVKGSQVTFSGVPIGKIDKIELWPRDPSFVRVRISVDKLVPILVGTTASMQSSFTGTGEILLEGAVKGAAPIVCPDDNPKSLCPEGAPVIPAKRGGLGAILNSAPLLLDRLATLTDRLNILMSDENQLALKGILANTNAITGHLAEASPQVKATLVELQGTLRQATGTLASFDKVAGSANTLLGDKNGSLGRELRATLHSAQGAADELKATLSDARPAARQLSDSTLPNAESALRELRAATRSLRSITDKIDEQGAGALAGGSKLPDFKP